MRDEQKIQLQLLSEQYKDAYAVEAEAKLKKDDIKDKIKALVGQEDFINDILSVKHFEKETIAYKQMIIDANITVPDKYKKKHEEIRLTIKKVKQENK